MRMTGRELTRSVAWDVLFRKPPCNRSVPALLLHEYLGSGDALSPSMTYTMGIQERKRTGPRVAGLSNKRTPRDMCRGLTDINQRRLP